MLDIDTSLGDGAQLAHSSSLYEGQAIPAGERRQGSPAEQRAEVDLQPIEPLGRSALRSGTYAALQLVGLLAVYLPLAVGGIYLVATQFSPLDALLQASPADITTWAFLRNALIASSRHPVRRHRRSAC